MKRVLFVCSQNRLRSPTAEAVFSNRDGFEVASAGTDPAAGTPVSPELLEWADVIFVMERAHRNRLMKKFRPHLKAKRLICLDIPDEFEYMDPALVRLLELKAGPFFKRG
ncbi:MAG TPA: low molecular weight protein tyrosine phosphatase family protein [Steroidobacteraceae bacterium]|nr:low molecular weight protein tyrosine phosphatase family protein [Steroidobacteraceae bacterium]